MMYLRTGKKMIPLLVLLGACSENNDRSGTVSDPGVTDSVLLSHFSLTQIPDSIWKSSGSIEYADISDNAINLLPAEFCSLKELRTVDLSNNYLFSLPGCFHNLQKLEKVKAFDYNCFPFEKESTDPSLAIEELSRLPALKALAIRWRECTTIPGNIGLLTNLDKLELTGGDYDSLPQSLFDLGALSELNLMNNQLNPVSDSIGNMSGLKVLDLSNNGLTKVPDGIGNLNNLESLFLARNQLTTLPESMKNLTKLKILDLSENNFGEEEINRIRSWFPNTDISF